MSFLFRSKDRMSASQAALEVKEQYDVKINQFLHRVDAAGPRWLPDVDLLGRLFSWGEKTWIERNKLEGQLSSAEGRFALERNKLQSQLSSAEGRFTLERNKLQSQLSQAEQTMKTDRKRFQSQFSKTEEKNRTEQAILQSQLLEAQERIRRLEANLAGAKLRITSIEDENENIKTQHREELDNLTIKYSTVTKKEKDNYGREVKKLVGQLLVNQEDNLGWTDDKLKFRFQQLQNSIKSLVSPRNKEYRIPPESNIGLDLDPTGFLAHTTRSNAHFLLQNILWTILYDQFFSIPFGFGVLGDGEAQKKLLDLVNSWIELLGKNSRQDSRSNQVFLFFRQSRVTNNWRSAIFQCINEALMETSGKTDTSSAPITKLITDNVNQAIARMTSVLSEVSRLSGSNPRSEIEELQQIALQARDLALQFGLHPAQLQLYMPKHGDEVQIGEDVYDCEDGDCERGAKPLVALVTLPGLQKFGDGRADIRSKRTLVPCEIYPK